MSNIVTAAGPRLALCAAPTGLTIAAGALAAAQSTPAPEPAPAPAPAPEPTPPQPPAPPATTPPVQASGPVPAADAAAPRPSAFAGSTTTVVDGAIYTFDGRGDSLVRDVFAAQAGDLEAMTRLAAFNRAMFDEDSRQSAIVAGVAARVQADGRLATAAVEVRDAGNENLRPVDLRGDQMLHAIDKGRPLVSRVRQVPISGPDPFRLPTFGDFDDVGDHVEGTAHVAEGTVDDVGVQIVVPTAVSGAYRLSRELAESNGPRMDALVLAEMVKAYRRRSEARLVARLEATVAATQATIDTPAELLAQFLAFYTARQESATVIAAGTTAYAGIASWQAGDGRPYFPYFNPTNAAGSSSAGLASLNIQGVPGIPSWSADLADLWMLYGDDVAVFESAPRLFRFEEVEGPGIIKLAIWGYQAAHVYRTEGVRRLGYGA
jgi:hypothetical protein